MNRFLTLGIAVLCTQLLCSATALAGGSRVAAAMGDLRWGMSEFEVARFAKDQLEQHYRQAIRSAASPGEKGRLKSELNKRLAGVDGAYVQFDGTPLSRWDNSPVAGEFTYGNMEGLLVVEDMGTTNYYFFINDELWKWVQFMDASQLGGRDFSKFSSVVKKRFGRGVVKKGTRLANTAGDQRWVEFYDRRSRLRAVDHTRRHGAYALVFEDMEALRHVPALRAHTSGPAEAGSQEPGATAGASVPVPVTESGAGAVPRRSAERRSVAAVDGESSGTVAARARKRERPAQAKTRKAQSRSARRKKKAEDALEGLGSMESDDPLAGL